MMERADRPSISKSGKGGSMASENEIKEESFFIFLYAGQEVNRAKSNQPQKCC